MTHKFYNKMPFGALEIIRKIRIDFQFGVNMMGFGVI